MILLDIALLICVFLGVLFWVAVGGKAVWHCATTATQPVKQLPLGSPSEIKDESLLPPNYVCLRDGIEPPWPKPYTTEDYRFMVAFEDGYYKHARKEGFVSLKVYTFSADQLTKV